MASTVLESEDRPSIKKKKIEAAHETTMLRPDPEIDETPSFDDHYLTKMLPYVARKEDKEMLKKDESLFITRRTQRAFYAKSYPPKEKPQLHVLKTVIMTMLAKEESLIGRKLLQHEEKYIYIEGMLYYDALEFEWDVLRHRASRMYQKEEEKYKDTKTKRILEISAIAIAQRLKQKAENETGVSQAKKSCCRCPCCKCEGKCA